MQTFVNFKEAEAALEPFLPSRLKRFAYTTEHIQEFMHYVGDPQNKPHALHIAGTSGKTSTAYYAASLLKAAGKKVGLLVSPHAETINERVQIDLVPLPEKEFCTELSLFLEVVRGSGIVLTFAEILYAFAYWEFARHQVEYIVVETGMGGLLDATNVIHTTGKICVITDIGMDHTNVLGNTLQEIAQHKTGIIQPHNTVFCHAQPREIIDEIRTACQRNCADLHILGQLQRYTPAGLPLIQQRNFDLALHAVRFALGRGGKPPLTDTQIQRAARVRIPGRLEIVPMHGKMLVLDGAHNPQKMRALRQSIEAFFPGEQVAVLCGLVDGRGRVLEEMVAELAPLASHVIVTSLPAHASRDPNSIGTAFQKIGAHSLAVIPRPGEAYQSLLARPEPVLLVTGSFYLLEVLRPALPH